MAMIEGDRPRIIDAEYKVRKPSMFKQNFRVGAEAIGGGIRRRIQERQARISEEKAIYNENYRAAKRKAIASRARREAFASESGHSQGRVGGIMQRLSNVGYALNQGNPAITGGMGNFGIDLGFGAPRRRSHSHRKKSSGKRKSRSGRRIVINL